MIVSCMSICALLHLNVCYDYVQRYGDTVSVELRYELDLLLLLLSLFYLFWVCCLLDGSL